ncbi:hypothetical protein RI129_004571 [Pyrocoelia pectoralis]|uniref:BESS domain-containing protein n=1 Tax=Pyrocoelia pectoralis TaxID=417401 RepID=A0AAN7VE76_9COLE
MNPFSKHPVHRIEIPPATTLSVFIVLVILDKPKEQPKEQHPIDLFFESMTMTVKKFSPANQIRARMEICQTVSQLELEEVNRDSTLTLHLPCPQFDASSSASRGSNVSLDDDVDDDEALLRSNFIDQHGWYGI